MSTPNTTVSLTDYLEARAVAVEAAAATAPEAYAGWDENAELRRRQLAEYTTRRLLAIEREIALAQLQAEAAIADVETWLQDILAPLHEKQAHAMLLLRAIGEAHLTAHPKGAKHLDVRVGRASARLSFSRAPGSLKVLDADIAIAALREAGLVEALKTEEIPARTVVKPVLADLKKHLVKPEPKAGGSEALLPAVVAATGEVLAGLGWEIDPELRVRVEPPKRFAREDAGELDGAAGWHEEPQEDAGAPRSRPIYEASERERMLARVASDPEAARRELLAEMLTDVQTEQSEREAVLADYSALEQQEEAAHV